MRRLRAWWRELRERKLHDDRDPECIYWWGDRSGYPLHGPGAPKCPLCTGRW